MKRFEKMSEAVIKKYFRSIIRHTTKRDFIISTLSWFETDEELEEMISILDNKLKMSISEIELEIIEQIVEKRKKE